MNLTDMQQMMVDDGLPVGCIMTKAERDASWAKNPPRAMPAQTRPTHMSLEDQRVWWQHHIIQLEAKERVQGTLLPNEIGAAKRELAKLGGDVTMPAKPAMAAVRATVAARSEATPRPVATAPKGQTPPSRRVESAMADASVVRGIDNDGLVTADDLSKEFGVPAKFIRYLLRTHKPVPKPSWGWSFDASTVETVREFLRTKTNTASKIAPTIAVSREVKNAPATTIRVQAKKTAKPVKGSSRVRPAKNKSKKRR